MKCSASRPIFCLNVVLSSAARLERIFKNYLFGSRVYYSEYNEIKLTADLITCSKIFQLQICHVIPEQTALSDLQDDFRNPRKHNLCEVFRLNYSDVEEICTGVCIVRLFFLNIIAHGDWQWLSGIHEREDKALNGADERRAIDFFLADQQLFLRESFVLSLIHI